MRSEGPGQPGPLSLIYIMKRIKVITKTEIGKFVHCEYEFTKEEKEDLISRLSKTDASEKNIKRFISWVQLYC